MKEGGSVKLNNGPALRMFLLVLLLLELMAAVVLSTRLFRSDGGRTRPITLAEEGMGATLGFRTQRADGKTELHGEANGVYVRDAQNIVWEKETEVEIFHVRYDDNGDMFYTVESDGEDKVLAPGTENCYRFTLINTLKAPLNYILDVECRVEGDEGLLPVEARLSDSSGRYLLGGASDWAPVRQLDGITDQRDMGAEESMEYALEWRWPFERSDAEHDVAFYDAQDTGLGNAAVSRDITLYILLRTNAEIGRDFAGRAWALVNLICTALTCGLGGWDVVSVIRGRGGEGENDALRRKRRSKLWNIAPAVGAVAAFILTEDMRLPMTIVDRWTPLMAVILAMSVTVALLTKSESRKKALEEAGEEAKETVGAK